jgi:putative endonuclease
MTAARQATGRRGEDLVAAALERRGATLLARNARAPEVRGEIDLIALDRGELAFVEVKARRSGNLMGPESPVVAVGLAKQRKLRSLAMAWLAANRDLVPSHDGLRFDVVGVVLDSAGRPLEWEWIESAF